MIPRDGATIFRDIVGKLDVLNVESDKGGRRGRYPAHRLVERYGMDAKLFDWSNKITAEASAKLERPVRRTVPGPIKRWCKFGNGVSDYLFQMGKSESRLFSLSDSRTFNQIASSSTSLAKASSSWIASISQFLETDINQAINNPTFRLTWRIEYDSPAV